MSGMTAGPSPDPSQEHFASVSTGVDLCYQTFGDPDGEPLLLVMGLGGPMTWWHPELCRMLADRGFHVIRFDNRDVGRSTHADGRIARHRLLRSFVGVGGGVPPYSLADMAEDGVALLDHLGHDGGHVVGVSMGGMIAQTMAVHHPDRIRSLTSIMSTTGRRTVGWQDPRLLPLMLARRAADKDAYIESSVRFWRVVSSTGYREELEAVRSRAAETWERGINPAGIMRQMAAIVSQPDRTHALRELDLPALVIHGLDDRMVHVSGGRATASALRSAELLLVPGMGHDLPKPLYETFADAISRTAARAYSGSEPTSSARASSR